MTINCLVILVLIRCLEKKITFIPYANSHQNNSILPYNISPLYKSNVTSHKNVIFYYLIFKTAMSNFIFFKNAAFLKWMFEELWVKEMARQWQMAISRYLFRCGARLRQRDALVCPARATSEVLPFFTKNVASRVYHVFSAKVCFFLFFTLTWIMWF